MANIVQDTTAPKGVLDSLFDTGNRALDLWAQWSNQKVQNTQAKAAIPSVAQPSPSFDSFAGLSKTALLWIGGGVAVLVGLLLFIPRRK